MKLFDYNNGRLAGKKIDAEYLSSEIDMVVRFTQARINLFRGFSELGMQSGINDKAQQFSMLYEEILNYTDHGK